MEYIILSEPDPCDLSIKITEYLKKGWRLHGNHTVINWADSLIQDGIRIEYLYYSQAIIKED